ncbi:MAG: hypothetical protein EOO60_07935 [Hymenobacter sp.]|nr:MAG: hypothetical protein EOO60_07935 [Hymenobacter sp.]
MGLTLQFAIGKKEQIIEAVRSFDEDFLDLQEQEGKTADFSLHILPQDLDTLVLLASIRYGSQTINLRENLDTTQYFFDAEDTGAYYVQPIVSQVFAAIESEGATELVTQWFASMSATYQEKITPTFEATAAVQKLLVLAKAARDEALDLVHFWWL